MTEGFWTALGLTTFAGLSTGLGAMAAFFTKTTDKNLLSFSLGLSSGVMIYVSFMELLPEARTVFHKSPSSYGEVLHVLWFFCGVLFIAVIDKIIPEKTNPHEVKNIEEYYDNLESFHPGLWKTGIFSAIAIGIHNFPEGMAVFTAGFADIRIALPIAVAIAIHNIPEGIAVSFPLYHATGSRKKAFWYAASSGLAEPVGALVGYFTIFRWISDVDYLMGVLYSITAGIMVFISLDELLPAADKYGKHHYSIYGTVAGMAVMAFSLFLLKG